MRSVAARLGAILVCCCAVGALNAASRSKPRIDEGPARLDGERAVVSYRVVNSLSEETMERIQSGIPVSFLHKIEIFEPRGFWLPARETARLHIETRVEYDSLTRRYNLFRTSQVKTEKRWHPPPPVEERLETQSDEEMRAWMTVFDEIQIQDPYRPVRGVNLRVRINVSVGRRYVMAIFPAALTATGEWSLSP